MVAIRHNGQNQGDGSDSPACVLNDKRPKFPMGSLYMTPGVQSEVEHADLLNALGRHSSGDWGDVGPEDWNANEEALKNDLRLFSVYHGTNGTKFWIITEWDRSVTTALLPSEY